MQIKSYVKSELEYFLDACNFTEDEKAYFMLKALGETDVSISFKLCISTSTVTRLGRKVKTKISKVERGE